MKLQEREVYPSVHTSAPWESPCTASPLQPHPSMLGEAGMVEYPLQPSPGAGAFVPAAPLPSCPESYMPDGFSCWPHPKV